MNIVYIADFSLPNMSAYAVHVLKMCDALTEKKIMLSFSYLIKMRVLLLI